MDDQDSVLIEHQSHHRYVTTIRRGTNPKQSARFLVVEPALTTWTVAPGSQYLRLENSVLQDDAWIVTF